MPAPAFYKLNAHTSVGIIKPENLQVRPGQVFSRLTVCGNEFMLKREGGYAQRFVVVVCECGAVKCVNSAALVHEKVKSCGCLHRELNKARGKNNRTHNLRNTAIYRIWKGMKERCHNPARKDYPRYGGKGITVCHEWRTDFMAFYEWSVNNGWREGLTIDRIKNDLGYYPDNCRWVTPLQQMNNRQCTIWITHDGKTQSLADWCREPISKVPYKNALNRIQKGWDFVEAIESPVRRKAGCRPPKTKSSQK